MKIRLLDLFAGPGHTAPATVVHGPNHWGLALASPTPPAAPRITDGIACCNEPGPIEWAEPVQMLWASPRLSPQFTRAYGCWLDAAENLGYRVRTRRGPIEWAEPVQMLWASPRLSPQFTRAALCRATTR